MMYLVVALFGIQRKLDVTEFPSNFNLKIELSI